MYISKQRKQPLSVPFVNAASPFELQKKIGDAFAYAFGDFSVFCLLRLSALFHVFCLKFMSGGFVKMVSSYRQRNILLQDKRMGVSLLGKIVNLRVADVRSDQKLQSESCLVSLISLGAQTWAHGLQYIFC